ncbi:MULTISPECIES: hypothetical protein [Pseudomonas]|jgi:hypothetical protein|uniref:DUF4177 domain-containing protein n=1 Tax=Pseudomonas syringae pv. aptata TaxID=83167 RepID=A0A0Q0IRP5_PSEAP|nr:MULTISPECIES: hypothetical protein [Pseudomonas]KPZ04112.1 hypothetical protein ALO85_200028 [Pseudomonas syringae pv. aptata]RMO62937.1 hypothetical protein ALQ37_02776 [Pseudomonas syringae pv. aptata]
MQLYEVDEIKELFATGEVNDALTSGWRIVAVVSSVAPGGDLPVACYVMGRYLPKEDRL